MTLTKIEPKHALDDYIGMDAVTHLDASYKAVHSVVLAWVDSDLAPGGPPDYVRSGQDSHGPTLPASRPSPQPETSAGPSTRTVSCWAYPRNNGGTDD